MTLSITLLKQMKKFSDIEWKKWLKLSTVLSLRLCFFKKKYRDIKPIKKKRKKAKRQTTNLDNFFAQKLKLVCLKTKISFIFL